MIEQERHCNCVNSLFPVKISRKVEENRKTVKNGVLKYERSECFKLAMSNGF